MEQFIKKKNSAINIVRGIVQSADVFFSSLLHRRG